MSLRKRPDLARVEVVASNEQTDVPIDVDHWTSLAAHALDAEGIRHEAELSLVFVDEATIADLNKRYMGEDRATDVLAFPLDDEPMPGLPALLGDVVVCPSVAAAQAPEHGTSVEAELGLLVVHGVLHVLGHDHAEESETAAMQARERHILGTFRP